MIGLQGMITGMGLEMEVYWYGHVRHCGVGMAWPDFDVHCHCG